MTVSERYTLLPLDSWAAILGISPWEFNGFVFPAAKSAQCRDVFHKFQWQTDHLSISEVADAIADAEQMIANELLYWPAPYYVVDEVIQYPRNRNRQAWGFAGDIRGEWKTFSVNWHKVIKGGVINRTLIGTITLAGGGITLSDLDGDGIQETFTATITDAAVGLITDANELGLYFVAANRHGEDVGEVWRVRPVDVSISGNVATFQGHRTLLANPSKAYAVAPADMVATDAANYITSLDCYRTFTDDTATEALPYQGVAIWKDNPDCADQDCTFSIYPLCLGQHQNEQGQIFASYGSACDWPFPTREADRLQINYVSGVPLVNGKMEKIFAQMVAYLSVSLLANERCGCDRTNRILAKLRAPILKFQDRAADAESYVEAANTFPSTFGGQWAWARIRQNRHIEAIGI